MSNLKKALTAIIVLIASLMTTMAWAQITGSGSSDDPYVLHTAADWVTFANRVNGSRFYGDSYFKLSDTWDNSANPVTVTVGTKDWPFTGSFDGNFRTLTVNINETSKQGTAPFREINEGTIIKNLTVVGNVNGTTAAGWEAFAQRVNNGETGLDGMLVADVDLGNGHTLTVHYNTTAEYTAPFRFVNGGRIYNLHTAGTIQTSAKFAAGIVSNYNGERSALMNSRSSVTIISSVNGDGTHGGLIAVADGGTYEIPLLSHCVFDGKLLTTNGTTLQSRHWSRDSQGPNQLWRCLWWQKQFCHFPVQLPQPLHHARLQQQRYPASDGCVYGYLITLEEFITSGIDPKATREGRLCF